jgi:predicted ArsR family transcriptional regulator
VQYRITPAGEQLDHDFLGIAELLAAVVGRAGLTADQLRDVGREWGRYLVGRPGQYDLQERVPAVLARLGFEAVLDGDRVRLSGCPCPTVASDRPEIVCELATGVLDGVLGAAGAHQRVGEGHHDPARRRCDIQLVDVTVRR